MTVFYRHVLVACSVMTALLSFESGAAPQPDSWYIGAKAGWVKAAGACESNAVGCDDNPVVGGLFVGYVVNDWLALEAGYDYFSEVSATYPALGAPAHTAVYDSDVQGVSLVAKPYWQLNDNWSLFGKAGVMLWDVAVTGDEREFTHEADDQGGSPLLGAGVEYSFNRHWRTTLEYQWMNDVGGSETGGMDMNTVNLGIIYQFGSELVPEPEPVVAPVSVELPVTVTQQASWSLDGVMFASNSSTLSPAAEAALQPALQRLQANPQAHLAITAHTDSVGSAGDNLRLSERRAASVRDYFIQHGVPATQLTTKGEGESQPVADNATEAGRSQNRRVDLASPAFDVALPQGY